MNRGRSLEIRNLTIRYGDQTAVDDITLELRAGTTTALLGPSGSGKSSLLRAVAGLERPTAGSIHTDGELLSNRTHLVAPERRRIGMVFQNHVLFPHLTVADNVGFGLPRAARRGQRVDDVLELVGLHGLGHRDPATLSGGQQQRVALARALAPEPDFLLLDEPFASLDATLRVELRREMTAMISEVGVTTIFVTHDQHEAFALGDRVAVLRDGKLIQAGSPHDLYERPATPWLAGFVGEANLLRGVIGADTRRAATAIGVVNVDVSQVGQVPVPGDVISILIRPEDLHVAELDGMTPAFIPAAVTTIEYRGATTLLTTDIDGTLVRVNSSPSRRTLRPGDIIGLAPIEQTFRAWSVEGNDL